MVDDDDLPHRNDADPATCRICQIVQEDAADQLIRACNCNGTLKFVHTSCLQNWISVSSRLSCEICKRRYLGRKKYKYGVLASIAPYVVARWRQPKINFSLLIVFHLVEQLFVEARNFYFLARKRDRNSVKNRLLNSVLFRWLDYLKYPSTFTLLLLAFRDWSAWRQTQIVFVLNGRRSAQPTAMRERL